jgi:hypothetical protein
MTTQESKTVAFVFKNKKKAVKANFSELELNRCSFLLRALISAKASLPVDHTLAPIIVKLQNNSNNSILNIIAYVRDDALNIANPVDLLDLIVLAIALEIEPLALILLSYQQSTEKKKSKEKIHVVKRPAKNDVSLKELINEGKLILQNSSQVS